jgi:DUF4097 and DUF4098 domain-containing protein YvlB
MRKLTIIVPVLLAVLWMLTGIAAQAGEPVEESGKASADGRVYVENIAGSIKVTGWDKDEIHVEGTLGKEVEELKFKIGKKKSVIKVVYKKNLKNIREGADLVIMVPEGSTLEVDCISADVVTSKLEGSLELSSISGRVEFTGWCRDLDAESISGNVVVDGGADEMSLESISGRVEAQGEAAEIKAESVSGSIVLNYETYLDLSAETVSGDIKIVGDYDSRARISCDVVSGSVTLVVPGNVSANFEASTFSGNIDNDFGQKASRTSKYSPGKELEFTTGDGDADVELNSFSGDIRIRKK